MGRRPTATPPKPAAPARGEDPAAGKRGGRGGRPLINLQDQPPKPAAVDRPRDPAPPNSPALEPIGPLYVLRRDVPRIGGPVLKGTHLQLRGRVDQGRGNLFRGSVLVLSNYPLDELDLSGDLAEMFAAGAELYLERGGKPFNA